MTFNNYNDLKKAYQKLKHYAFEDKIGFCFNHALYITRIDTVELGLENEIYPWELEYLTELCLLSIEDVDCKPLLISDIEELVTIIRNYKHSHFNEIDESFVSDIMMVFGITQFKVQENIYHRLFRFLYYFNFKNDHVDISTTFKERFGCSYYDFVSLAIMVRFFLTKEISGIVKDFSPEIWKHILCHYPQEIKQLSITRQKYIEDQTEKNDNSIENGLYGLNYLHSYPFIDNNDRLYLPLPYLLVDAVTDSLFTRLTWDNPRLRETIGKHVAENYLALIMRSGNVYDEVFTEKCYKKGSDWIASPDVMVRKDENICLFDSKLSTPPISIRHFDAEGIEKMISIYVGNVEQLYKRINDFELYNPFEKNISYSREKIFGIVTVNEYSYILKERIYNELFSKLDLKETSEEAEYIVSHIMVLPLSEIEKYALYGCNIFPEIINRSTNRTMWMDLLLDNDPIKKTASAGIIEYRTFVEEVEELRNMAIQDIVECFSHYSLD